MFDDEPSWTETFEGAPGSPPNPATWTYELGGGGGWGLHQDQFYTDSTAYAAHTGDGQLVVCRLKSLTFGGVQVRASQGRRGRPIGSYID